PPRALPSCPTRRSSDLAAQLVVDAPRLVPLGADDVQPAGLDHPVVQLLPLAVQLLGTRTLLVFWQVLGRLEQLDLLLDVAAEHEDRKSTRLNSSHGSIS